MNIWWGSRSSRRKFLINIKGYYDEMIIKECIYQYIMKKQEIID